MNDRDDDRLGGNENSYVLELRKGRDTTEIAIVGLSRSGPAARDEVAQDAWSASFVDPDAARTVFDLLSARTTALAGWGRMARLLGPRFLDGVLDSEIEATAFRGVAQPSPTHPLSIDGYEAGRSDGSIRMQLRWRDDAKYILASRNDRSFLVVTGRSNVATRRIWDWVRWQGRTYRRWFAIADRSGPGAAVDTILEGMVAAERSALERGTPRDPQRPLRYWRPASWQKGLDPEGEGPSEAFG